MKNIELVWGSRVVFFGEASQGKSTLMGFMFAESEKVNMDRHEEDLREELGKYYKDEYLYSSLINPLVLDISDSNQRYRTRRYHLRNFVIKDEDPIIITMIDTPGQIGPEYRRARSNQDYGTSKGKIGVFCLSMNAITDEGFNGSVFNRTKLWRATHRNGKLIIALTKFDDNINEFYKESDYQNAVNIIQNYFNDSEIACIIPTAIDFKNRKGTNVFSGNNNIEWYRGLSLIDAIKERYFEIANNTFTGFLPSDLIFSIDREYAYPRSNAGKVWKVYIENGVLKPGTPITLTSVKRENHTILEPISANATVKELRMDIKIDYDIDEEQCAYRDSTVSINLKDCYIDGDKVKKREIETTEQTIGLSASIEYKMLNKLFIRFVNEEDLLKFKSEKQEALCYIFGRGTSIKVSKFADDLSGVIIETISDKFFTFPTRDDLQSLTIFKDIIIRIPAENNDFDYLPAKIDFDLTNSIS
ncbi:MAG: hypothetical protein LBM60_05535 [Clostridium sp.]|jgi:translation elongation factor EF-1alpha|nr:hypothetical protein [Clostridium sp.]